MEPKTYIALVFGLALANAVVSCIDRHYGRGRIMAFTSGVCFATGMWMLKGL